MPLVFEAFLQSQGGGFGGVRDDRGALSKLFVVAEQHRHLLVDGGFDGLRQLCWERGIAEWRLQEGCERNGGCGG